jgi:glycosyltransferase involved in cell wall biosynthesis
VRSKKLLIILIISCGLPVARAFSAAAQAPEFVLIVPSYNNEKWYKLNLDSLVFQRSSKPYKTYYVNDRSLDTTGKKVESYIKEHKLERKVTVIHNQQRAGALANIYNTVHTYCKDDQQIVVLVDGDDFLQDPQGTLLYLEAIYKDPDIWMTYGQFRYWPAANVGSGALVPRRILEERKLRAHPFTLCPLRTFKAGLFKKIKKEDLMHKGQFFTMTYDVAIMIPMMEMCAPKDIYSKNHSFFIRDPLYRYNYQNSLSDFRINRTLQEFFDTLIRAKKPYQPLDRL